MSQTDGRIRTGPRNWSAAGSHDWDGPVGIEASLMEALEPSETVSDPLFDSIDAEALIEVLSPGQDRGASHVCFEYGDLEVKVESDGSISTRRQRL
jgi:hypothetical protein